MNFQDSYGKCTGTAKQIMMEFTCASFILIICRV